MGNTPQRQIAIMDFTIPVTVNGAVERNTVQMAARESSGTEDDEYV
jgi:hypothetical protein